MLEIKKQAVLNEQIKEADGVNKKLSLTATSSTLSTFRF